MPDIHFVSSNGDQHTVTAPTSLSVMEAATRNGVAGIDADCGGACACATCHVIVADDWWARLDPASETEAAMLEYAVDPTARSRLACQIRITDELDGLVVHTPESQR